MYARTKFLDTMDREIISSMVGETGFEPAIMPGPKPGAIPD